MLLSAVPPPETKSPWWWGDQAIALTAALWSSNLQTGLREFRLQTNSLLSFPPEQSCCPSNDHFKPQTYCLWLLHLTKWSRGLLKSLFKIFLSLEPVVKVFIFHAIDPTLAVCPAKLLVFTTFTGSHTYTCPFVDPTANKEPSLDHETDVIASEGSCSHNLVTFEFWEFHR